MDREKLLRVRLQMEKQRGAALAAEVEALQRQNAALQALSAEASVMNKRSSREYSFVDHDNEDSLEGIWTSCIDRMLYIATYADAVASNADDAEFDELLLFDDSRRVRELTNATKSALRELSNASQRCVTMRVHAPARVEAVQQMRAKRKQSARNGNNSSNSDAASLDVVPCVEDRDGSSTACTVRATSELVGASLFDMFSGSPLPSSSHSAAPNDALQTAGSMGNEDVNGTIDVRHEFEKADVKPTEKTVAEMVKDIARRRRDALFFGPRRVAPLSSDQLLVDRYCGMRYRFHSEFSRQLAELHKYREKLDCGTAVEDELSRMNLNVTALNRESIHAQLISNSADDSKQAEQALDPLAFDSLPICATAAGAARLHDSRQLPPTGSRPLLNNHRRCYICRRIYREIHPFYDKMCSTCGDENWTKRDQTADLAGFVCFVTGCRIKIGFQVTMRLLRAGAIVLGTTRFPHDALSRFQQEPDFDIFAPRLHIFGIDLCVLSDVEELCEHITEQYPTIDIIINNAALTVDKPAQFYRDLIDAEIAISCSRGPVRAPGRHTDLATRAVSQSRAASGMRGSTAMDPQTALSPWLPSAHRERGSALWASLVQTTQDVPAGQGVFDVRDEDKNVVDLRLTNTWRSGLEEVPTSEFLRIQSCNVFAPFVIMRTLGGAMIAQRALELAQDVPMKHKYIVNVSAMEGVFYTNKTGHHAHTNAAKAALNMMTRTVGEEWASRYKIFCTAIDTGWCTDEKPLPDRLRLQNNNGSSDCGVFSPPLDCEDGAARVLDPIFSRVRLGAAEQLHSVFLKDYRPSLW